LTVSAFFSASPDCVWDVIASMANYTNIDPNSVTVKLSELSLAVMYSDLHLPELHTTHGNIGNIGNIGNTGNNGTNSQTFEIRLSASGEISMIYYTYHVESAVSKDQQLLAVGLLQSWERNPPQKVSVELGWNIPDVYGTRYLPSRSSIQSQTRITFCPIPVDFCFFPRVGPISGGTEVYFIAEGLRIKCADNYQWECSFGGVRVPGYFDLANQRVACVASRFLTAHSNISDVLKSGGSDPVVLVELFADGEKVLTTCYLWYTYLRETRSPKSPESPESPVVPVARSPKKAICDACASVLPQYCHRDCAGVTHGTARLDDCLQCIGGSTGRTRNQASDCMNICYGPFIHNKHGKKADKECRCNFKMGSYNFLCFFYSRENGPVSWIESYDT